MTFANGSSSIRATGSASQAHSVESAYLSTQQGLTSVASIPFLPCAGSYSTG